MLTPCFQQLAAIPKCSLIKSLFITGPIVLLKLRFFFFCLPLAIRFRHALCTWTVTRRNSDLLIGKEDPMLYVFSVSYVPSRRRTVKTPVYFQLLMPANITGSSRKEISLGLLQTHIWDVRKPPPLFLVKTSRRFRSSRRSSFWF